MQKRYVVSALISNEKWMDSRHIVMLICSEGAIQERRNILPRDGYTSDERMVVEKIGLSLCEFTQSAVAGASADA